MTMLTTRIFTWLHGQLVGEDTFGNRYYTTKRPREGRQKRWVQYKGAAEPSKVPPEWHGWLHHTHAQPPNKRNQVHHAWEKPHLPNLTGTVNAYVPPGHLLRGGHRTLTTSDYEPWQP